MLKLSSMFSDHMVLQRDKEIAVWGQADADAKITVEFAGKKNSTTANANGRWLVKLPALAASSDPRELVVRSGKSHEQIKINDVLVGEVWIGSGQSNMQWSVSQCDNNEAEVAAANHPLIRLYTVPRNALASRQDNVDAKWQLCLPGTIGDFSATAYYFGRELQQKLGVPVGLINSSWGGTRIEAWMSREMLMTHEPSKQEIVTWESTPVSEEDQKTWDEFARDPAAWERKLVGPDPENLGFSRGWASLDFDATSWKEMLLPSHWQDHGHNYSAVFWFRREIQLPASWAGQDLQLRIGACDKHDITYFNNQLVGSMGWEIKDAWCKPRIYRIPGQLVRAGKNVIAVRVYSHIYHGGMTGPAENMQIEKLDASDTPISISGAWRSNLEHNLGLRTPPKLPMGPGNPNTPFTLFDSMIWPLLPFGIGGFIWYQGESNADQPLEYRKLLRLMIQDWRRAFEQGNVPFLTVELPNYTSAQEKPSEGGWALLREAQRLSLAEPNTGIAGILDLGEAMNIHPTNKQDVGKRLAAVALSQIFHQDVAWSGPIYKSHTIEGDAIRVHFDHVAGGLRTRDGGAVKGFAIAGADGVFHWAQATINSHSVSVRSSAVPKPVAVRHAWASNPICNLINSHGLPASSFRTDVESAL